MMITAITATTGRIVPAIPSKLVNIKHFLLFLLLYIYDHIGILSLKNVTVQPFGCTVTKKQPFLLKINGS